VEQLKETIYSLYFTVKDIGTQVTPADVYLKDVNIHIETNDIYYGNKGNLTATGKAGAIITLQGTDPTGINLRDLVVKNKTAGQTAYLSIVGSIK
jgi:hypothetical protein